MSDEEHEEEPFDDLVDDEDAEESNDEELGNNMAKLFDQNLDELDNVELPMDMSAAALSIRAHPDYPVLHSLSPSSQPPVFSGVAALSESTSIQMEDDDTILPRPHHRSPQPPPPPSMTTEERLLQIDDAQRHRPTLASLTQHAKRPDPVLAQEALDVLHNDYHFPRDQWTVADVWQTPTESHHYSSKTPPPPEWQMAMDEIDRTIMEQTMQGLHASVGVTPPPNTDASRTATTAAAAAAAVAATTTSGPTWGTRLPYHYRPELPLSPLHQRVTHDVPVQTSTYFTESALDKTLNQQYLEGPPSENCQLAALIGRVFADDPAQSKLTPANTEYDNVLEYIRTVPENQIPITPLRGNESLKFGVRDLRKHREFPILQRKYGLTDEQVQTLPKLKAYAGKVKTVKTTNRAGQDVRGHKWRAWLCEGRANPYMVRPRRRRLVPLASHELPPLVWCAYNPNRYCPYNNELYEPLTFAMAKAMHIPYAAEVRYFPVLSILMRPPTLDEEKYPKNVNLRIFLQVDKIISFPFYMPIGWKTRYCHATYDVYDEMGAPPDKHITRGVERSPDEITLQNMDPRTVGCTMLIGSTGSESSIVNQQSKANKTLLRYARDGDTEILASSMRSTPHSAIELSRLASTFATSTLQGGRRPSSFSRRGANRGRGRGGGRGKSGGGGGGGAGGGPGGGGGTTFQRRKQMMPKELLAKLQTTPNLSPEILEQIRSMSPHDVSPEWIQRLSTLPGIPPDMIRRLHKASSSSSSSSSSSPKKKHVHWADRLPVDHAAATRPPSSPASGTVKRNARSDEEEEEGGGGGEDEDMIDANKDIQTIEAEAEMEAEPGVDEIEHMVDSQMDDALTTKMALEDDVHPDHVAAGEDDDAPTTTTSSSTTGRSVSTSASATMTTTTATHAHASAMGGAGGAAFKMHTTVDASAISQFQVLKEVHQVRPLVPAGVETPPKDELPSIAYLYSTGKPIPFHMEHEMGQQAAELRAPYNVYSWNDSRVLSSQPEIASRRPTDTDGFGMLLQHKRGKKLSDWKTKHMADMDKRVDHYIAATPSVKQFIYISGWVRWNVPRVFCGFGVTDPHEMERWLMRGLEYNPQAIKLCQAIARDTLARNEGITTRQQALAEIGGAWSTEQKDQNRTDLATQGIYYLKSRYAMHLTQDRTRAGMEMKLAKFVHEVQTVILFIAHLAEETDPSSFVYRSIFTYANTLRHNFMHMWSVVFSNTGFVKRNLQTCAPFVCSPLIPLSHWFTPRITNMATQRMRRFDTPKTGVPLASEKTEARQTLSSTNVLSAQSQMTRDINRVNRHSSSQTRRQDPGRMQGFSSPTDKPTGKNGGLVQQLPIAATISVDMPWVLMVQLRHFLIRHPCALPLVQAWRHPADDITVVENEKITSVTLLAASSNHNQHATATSATPLAAAFVWPVEMGPEPELMVRPLPPPDQLALAATAWIVSMDDIPILATRDPDRLWQDMWKLKSSQRELQQMGLTSDDVRHIINVNTREGRPIRPVFVAGRVPPLRMSSLRQPLFVTPPVARFWHRIQEWERQHDPLLTDLLTTEAGIKHCTYMYQLMVESGTIAWVDVEFVVSSYIGETCRDLYLQPLAHPLTHSSSSSSSSSSPPPTMGNGTRQLSACDDAHVHTRRLRSWVSSSSALRARDLPPGGRAMGIVELHPQAINSWVDLALPSIDHTMTSRSTACAALVKQAVPASNPHKYVSTAKHDEEMYHVETPHMSNMVNRRLLLHQYPITQNFHVAMLTSEGGAIEDGMEPSLTADDNGLMAGECIRRFTKTTFVTHRATKCYLRSIRATGEKDPLASYWAKAVSVQAFQLPLSDVDHIERLSLATFQSLPLSIRPRIEKQFALDDRDHLPIVNDYVQHHDCFWRGVHWNYAAYNRLKRRLVKRAQQERQKVVIYDVQRNLRQTLLEHNQDVTDDVFSSIQDDHERDERRRSDCHQSAEEMDQKLMELTYHYDPFHAHNPDLYDPMESSSSDEETATTTSDSVAASASADTEDAALQDIVGPDNEDDDKEENKDESKAPDAVGPLSIHEFRQHIRRVMKRSIAILKPMRGGGGWKDDIAFDPRLVADANRMDKHNPNEPRLHLLTAPLPKISPGIVSDVTLAQASSSPGMIHAAVAVTSSRLFEIADKASTPSGQKTTKSRPAGEDRTYSDDEGRVISVCIDPHGEGSRLTVGRQQMAQMSLVSAYAPGLVSSTTQRPFAHMSAYQNKFTDPKTPDVGQEGYDATMELPQTIQQIEVLTLLASAELAWKRFMVPHRLATVLLTHMQRPTETRVHDALTAIVSKVMRSVLTLDMSDDMTSYLSGLMSRIDQHDPHVAMEVDTFVRMPSATEGRVASPLAEQLLPLVQQRWLAEIHALQSIASLQPHWEPLSFLTLDPHTPWMISEAIVRQFLDEILLYHDLVVGGGGRTTDEETWRQCAWYMFGLRCFFRLSDSLIMPKSPLQTPHALGDKSVDELEVYRRQLLPHGKSILWSNRTGKRIPATAQTGFLPAIRPTKFARDYLGQFKASQEPPRDGITLQPTKNREHGGGIMFSYMDQYCIFFNGGQEFYSERVSHSDTAKRITCAKCGQIGFEDGYRNNEPTCLPCLLERELDPNYEYSSADAKLTQLTIWIQNQQHEYNRVGLRWRLIPDVNNPIAHVPAFLNQRPRV